LAANAPCFQEGYGTHRVGQPLLAVPQCISGTKADSQEWLSY
jgi:hypothetical protein